MISFWEGGGTDTTITAVEVGVPKLGNCLEMYTCAQACAQFVHSMCTNLDTPCTLKLLLGHPLYNGAVYMLAHRLGHLQFPTGDVISSHCLKRSHHNCITNMCHTLCVAT